MIRLKRKTKTNEHIKGRAEFVITYSVQELVLGLLLIISNLIVIYLILTCSGVLHGDMVSRDFSISADHMTK